MNIRKITFGGLICLLWWVHEILSIRVYENITESPQFTIDASSKLQDVPSLPTAPGDTEIITFNTNRQNKKSNQSNPAATTENRAITQQIEVDKQKINTLFEIVNNNQKDIQQIRNEPDKRDINIKNQKDIFRDKQQKWQIPSGVLPISTSASKSTNSSKRQIDGITNDRDFIPSLELGSFDDTQGFVPHSVYEPKSDSYSHSLLPPNKPAPNFNDNYEKQRNLGGPQINIQNYHNIGQVEDDSMDHEVRFEKPKFSIHSYEDLSSYKNTPSPPRNPVQNVKLSNDYGDQQISINSQNGNQPYKSFQPDFEKQVNSCENTNDKFDPSKYRLNPLNGLQAFQNDFDQLKNKYPELNDVINTYPMMEEMMKQKLAEKFQQTFFLSHKQSSGESDYDISSEENTNDKFRTKYDFSAPPFKITNFKYPSTEDAKVNIYPDSPQPAKAMPYNPLSSWIFNKKPSRDDESASQEVLAGEYYQGSKFPAAPYLPDDKKPPNDDSKKPLFIDSKNKFGNSPWKKVVHLLTAFLPVGLLISALTPNVININNTADTNFPNRQRSMDGDAHPTKLNNPLVDLFHEKLTELDSLQQELKGDEPQEVGCDDWNFCELARRGEAADTLTLEKIFWKLAHDVPDHIAERAGMKKLFKAIKSRDCSQFYCKKNHKLQALIEKSQEFRQNISSERDLEESKEAWEPDQKDGEDSVNQNLKARQRSGRRQKRTHLK